MGRVNRRMGAVGVTRQAGHTRVEVPIVCPLLRGTGHRKYSYMGGRGEGRDRRREEWKGGEGEEEHRQSLALPAPQPAGLRGVVQHTVRHHPGGGIPPRRGPLPPLLRHPRRPAEPRGRNGGKCRGGGEASERGGGQVVSTGGVVAERLLVVGAILEGVVR